MAIEHQDRIEKISEDILFDSNAFLVTNIKNIRYLTGFSGSFAFLLLTPKGPILMVDFRYLEQAKEETNIEVLDFRNSWVDSLKGIIRKQKIKKIFFEVTCSYEVYEKISKIKNIEIIPLEYYVEKLRAIKNGSEIESIKEAVKRAERAFIAVKNYIKEGIKERELANLLEFEIKKQGSQTIPFPIIVASGKNSSKPHWRSSDKTLNIGDFVIIDWGAECGGYYSDMTRTFIIGEASDKQREIYNIVNKARNRAINGVNRGVKAKEIDAKARNLIKQSGYGKFFGHSTGHGIGMDVHEFPRVNMKSSEIIKSGMVFTIEPGIYIENLGGVRIEDMILVDDNSFQVLTSLPTDLEIL